MTDAVFISNSQLRSADSEVVVSAAIRLTRVEDTATDSASAFSDSGRTNENYLFNRRQSSSVDGPHGHPYLKAYLQDAYGSAIPSTDVTVEVLDSDGTQEDTQNLTSDANGILSWGYTILDAHKAFNAFKRTTPDNQDNIGTHDIEIAYADVYRPTGSKTSEYTDPKSPITARFFVAPFYPGRAKDLKVTGREYGSGEPTVTHVDQFAVCAELIIAGMWSGNLADRTIDANGVPTSAATRLKAASGGDYAFKTSAAINESTGLVIDDGEHNPTDRAGRPFDYSGAFNFVGQKAVYNVTTVAGSGADAGSTLTSNEALLTPQGYSTAAGTASFDVLTSPGVDTLYNYYQGFASSAAQRNTFGMTSTSDETVGFTGDSGLYGYRKVSVEYSVAVLSRYYIEVGVQDSDVVAGEDVNVKARLWRIQPDSSRVNVAFDSAPVVHVDLMTGVGQPISTLLSATTTLVPSSLDYEYQFAAPAPAAGTSESYVIACVGRALASQLPVEQAFFRTGAIDTSIRMSVEVSGVDVSAARHIESTDEVEIFAQAIDLDSGATVDADPSPQPSVFIFRKAVTGAQFYDPATLTWLDVTGTPAAGHGLLADTGGYGINLGVIPGIGNYDIYVVATLFISGVRYTAASGKEILGAKNRHDRYKFDGAGFIGFPYK